MTRLFRPNDPNARHASTVFDALTAILGNVVKDQFGLPQTSRPMLSSSNWRQPDEWQTAVYEMADARGYCVEAESPAAITLRVPSSGSQLLVTEGPMVTVIAMNGIIFPSGRVPAELSYALHVRTAQLERGAWAVLEADGMAHFHCRSVIPSERLTSAELGDVADGLVAEVVQVQRTLRSQGFFR